MNEVNNTFLLKSKKYKIYPVQRNNPIFVEFLVHLVHTSLKPLILKVFLVNKALVHRLFTIVHSHLCTERRQQTVNDPTYNVLVKIAQALEEIAEHLEVISNELNGGPNG